ncbi:MAG TPA: GGDEF domain-containing protein [Bryobacteraceae bacterium]|jgi:diguanylate cyclase (GGDEF)-like protein|nr:GGDEF domain-containing protein [Bryobacteraceae bacterium]
MDAAIPIPDFAAFYSQEIGTMLLGLVFLFLYRQSRVVYFGLWAIAGLLRFLAGIFGFQLLRSGSLAWMAPYAVFEFGFAIVLMAAARAGFASSIKDWRTVLRLISILPIFVAVIYAFGWFSRFDGYRAADALVLCGVYFYNVVSLRHNSGVGARVFRLALVLLGTGFLIRALEFIGLYRIDRNYEPYTNFVLLCVLGFSAMAMWNENQIDRIAQLAGEVDYLRREADQRLDLDHLTGLLNQAALSRRVDQPVKFDGVVAVCDMDNFKDVNDRYGHLVGDEILRNIGNLLRSSIRHEDEAFRWGGDEFVILFRNQHTEVANKRMQEISARLLEFRVRGHGVLPITFSWGTAEAAGRLLRDSLDEADQCMYALKRAKPRPEPRP